MHKTTSNVALRNGAKLGVGGCGFAITAEQSEVECDATGSSFESSRALPLFLLKGKGVVADKASAKHIDTGGALGVVKNYFRTCRR